MGSSFYLELLKNLESRDLLLHILGGGVEQIGC